MDNSEYLQYAHPVPGPRRLTGISKNILWTIQAGSNGRRILFVVFSDNLYAGSIANTLEIFTSFGKMEGFDVFLFYYTLQSISTHAGQTALSFDLLSPIIDVVKSDDESSVATFYILAIIFSVHKGLGNPFCAPLVVPYKHRV